MNSDERKAIIERCDALMADFDQRHPEIAALIKVREAGRAPGSGKVNQSLREGNDR